MRPRLAGLILLAALLLLASTRLSTALESSPGSATLEATHVVTKSAAPAAAHVTSAATAEQHSPSPSTRSSDTAAARAGAVHNTAATDALFFFAFMLLIGIFTVHVLAFTRIPYTALLLVSLKREGREEGRERDEGTKAKAENFFIFFNAPHPFSSPPLSLSPTTKKNRKKTLSPSHRSGASSSASPSRLSPTSGRCSPPGRGSGRTSTRTCSSPASFPSCSSRGRSPSSGTWCAASCPPRCCWRAPGCSWARESPRSS